MKECIICKKGFIVKDDRQRCCSIECSKIRKKIYLKKYQKEYQKSDKYINAIKKYRISSNKYQKYQKEYQQTENFKASLKKYLKSDKGKLNMFKNRERKHNCIHSFTRREWKLKCDACHDICPCCHKHFDSHLHKLTLDHIFALYWADIYFKQTGIKFVYSIDKVMPLCFTCNRIKGNKLIKVF